MEIREQAQGRWPFIHKEAGIPPECLRDIHQPCPMCGGKDRFRYDDKDGRGRYYCNQCGAGDGFDLLMKYHGWDFKRAANEVQQLMGGTSCRPVTIKAPRTQEPPRTYAYAQDIWQSATWEGVHAHPYAIRKGITHAAGAARGVASGKLIGRGADCIVVPMRTLEGETVGVECINPEGVKQTFGNKGTLILGNDLDDTLPQLVVEGWATGVAWLESYRGNACTYICFGKGMIERLACDVADKYPTRKIVIVGEIDE